MICVPRVEGIRALCGFSNGSAWPTSEGPIPRPPIYLVQASKENGTYMKYSKRKATEDISKTHSVSITPTSNKHADLNKPSVMSVKCHNIVMEEGKDDKKQILSPSDNVSRSPTDRANSHSDDFEEVDSTRSNLHLNSPKDLSKHGKDGSCESNSCHIRDESACKDGGALSKDEDTMNLMHVAPCIKNVSDEEEGGEGKYSNNSTNSHVNEYVGTRFDVVEELDDTNDDMDLIDSFETRNNVTVIKYVVCSFIIYVY